MTIIVTMKGSIAAPSPKVSVLYASSEGGGEDAGAAVRIGVVDRSTAAARLGPEAAAPASGVDREEAGLLATPSDR